MRIHLNTAVSTVTDYHQRTKHHFHRYAAGPGGLDWASQPDPFRTYAGCPRLDLPLLDAAYYPSHYATLYRPGAISPHPLSYPNLSAVLELAFGLSAWKQYGNSRWALRCNPSSGNLHPTEAYLVIQGIADMTDGVYHYVSRDHALEQRCHFKGASSDLLGPGFLLGLSSIHWREAWKYGERAYRYCQHDVGHAIAAVAYAAAILGWQCRLQTTWSDTALAHLLGLDRQHDFGEVEPEHPDVLMWVGTEAPQTDCPPFSISDAQAQWTGQANRLSGYHAHDWAIIDTVAAACNKPASQAMPPPSTILPDPLSLDNSAPAVTLIRQRRSAQDFDGTTSITAHQFFRMLDMTLPRDDRVPWNALAGPPCVHLALFVHRVNDLEPGVYILPRRLEVLASMQQHLSSDFDWQRVSAAPAHLPLYRVVAADARAAAKALSCHQDIAADGAFSLGMVAEFDAALEQAAWHYRRLFWECGMIGQVLYLEAEAAGVRGTGIGCFFDDAVHEILGIRGTWLQSLYHFTIGGSVQDMRLQTLPPYAHLGRPGSP